MNRSVSSREKTEHLEEIRRGQVQEEAGSDPGQGEEQTVRKALVDFAML